MAYDPEVPPSLVTQAIGGPQGLRWFALMWVDPIADVLVAGYISNALDLGMREGDGLLYKDTNRGEWDQYALIVQSIAADGSATVAFPEVPEEAYPEYTDPLDPSDGAQVIIMLDGRQYRVPIEEAAAAILTGNGLLNLSFTPTDDLDETPDMREAVDAVSGRFIPIRYFDAAFGTGADDGATLNAAMTKAYTLGKGIDLCGLDVLTSVAIVLQCSLISSHGVAIGSSITAMPAFAGDFLVNLEHPTNPYRNGQVVEGIRFSAGANAGMSVISTDSEFGGGGKIGVTWRRCDFTSVSVTDYALVAATAGGTEQGAFTGHVFEDCHWYAPLPFSFGDNQDDITFRSPRIQLTGSSAVALTPMITHGNNIVVEGTTFVAMENGINYSTGILWSAGNGIVDIGTIFLEDDDVNGHNFASLFACTMPRANFTVGPVRMNAEYMGASATDAVVRVNLASTDSAEKVVRLRGASSYGAPGAVLPTYLFSAFMGSGVAAADAGETVIVADVHFTVGDEWSAAGLLASVTGSTAAQGYRTRLHGHIGKKMVERAYQINAAAAVPTRRDLLIIPETNVGTVTVDALVGIRPGILTLTNASGATRSVGIGSINALEEVKDGAMLRVTNSASSTHSITVRDAYLSGQAIAFPAAGTLKTLAVGESLLLMWKMDTWIEVVDPA